LTPIFSLYDLLRNIPLFRVLSNTALMNFADKLVLEIIPADKVVIKEGLPGNALYIIKSGHFKVVNYLESTSEEVILAELSSGDYFGEMALLTDEPRSASVIALKDSELFKLDKEDFEILLSREPIIYKTLGLILAQRLRESNIKRINVEANLREKRFTEGSIENTSLLDLLRFSEEHHFSGQIKILQNDDTAQLNLSKGDLVGVHLNGVSDRDGLKKILAWKTGKFEVIPAVNVRQKDITIGDDDPSAISESAVFDNILINAINQLVLYAAGILGNSVVKNILRNSHEILIKDHPVLDEVSILANCTVAFNERGDFKVHEKTTIASAMWMSLLVSEFSKLALGFNTIKIEEITEEYSEQLKQIAFYQLYENSSGIDFS